MVNSGPVDPVDPSSFQAVPPLPGPAAEARARVGSILLVVLVLLLWPSAAPRAQELEPRAYSPAPVGTNFLVATYSHTSGSVLVDPSLPFTDVEARIESAAVGYVRTLGPLGPCNTTGSATEALST